MDEIVGESERERECESEGEESSDRESACDEQVEALGMKFAATSMSEKIEVESK